MKRLLYVMPLVALCGCANMRVKMSAVDLDARKPDQILAANADVAAFYRVEPTVAVQREQKASLKDFEATLSVDKNYDKRKSFADRIKKAFGKDE